MARIVSRPPLLSLAAGKKTMITRSKARMGAVYGMGATVRGGGENCHLYQKNVFLSVSCVMGNRL